MKIALYGISRSGKDYLINDLIKYLASQEISLFHVHGSATLNSLAPQIMHRPFNALGESEKKQIRKEFIAELNYEEQQHGNIIVDGHFSFYNDSLELYDVFTKEDMDCYDAFFYLDTPAHTVLDRLAASEDGKADHRQTMDTISRWKDHEIRGLCSELIKRNKELHVITYDDIETLDYIGGVLAGLYSSETMAKMLLRQIDGAGGFTTVFLVDCDKTLSIEDTTNIALSRLGLHGDVLRNIYAGDRYTNYQAYRAKQYCDSIEGLFSTAALDHIQQNITMNKPLIDDLKAKTDALILAVTAGSCLVWSKILEKQWLNAIVLDANMLMSKFTKYFIMKQLREQGKYVVAIGDSMLDSLMLIYAHKSYIVSNKGLRENMRQLLISNKQIHQLEYSRFLYDCSEVEPHLSCIKHLDVDEPNIAAAVSICKSDSGAEGKHLRDAHYFLGSRMAELLRQDFPQASFAVVIMMRSGLPFGQGIVDTLDCPELFYTEGDSNKFFAELTSNEAYKEKTLVLCDGVINSGKTLVCLMDSLCRYRCIVVSNVTSDKFQPVATYPVYTTRLSMRSFTGAKQRTVENGKGPDTSDRLFRTL